MSQPLNFLFLCLWTDATVPLPTNKSMTNSFSAVNGSMNTSVSFSGKVPLGLGCFSRCCAGQCQSLGQHHFALSFWWCSSNEILRLNKRRLPYCRNRAFRGMVLGLFSIIDWRRSSNLLRANFRNISPRTTCLYPAGSTLPLNLLADSHRVSSIPFCVTLFLPSVISFRWLSNGMYNYSCIRPNGVILKQTQLP